MVCGRKDSAFFDVAVECAAAHGADPSTLVRAARDFCGKEPQFSATVAMLAISSLLAGGGYDPVGTALGNWLEIELAEDLRQRITYRMPGLHFNSQEDHTYSETPARSTSGPVPTAVWAVT